MRSGLDAHSELDDRIHGMTAARTAVLVICALTLFRLLAGLYDATELSTDEAQYWSWGQDLSFGAYSKPPLIGWIARGATEIFGQSVWAVRLPAALIHGLAAMALLFLGLRLERPGIAAVAAVSYLTTPAVALGSALMTTDTPLLLAATLALIAQHRLAEARDKSQRGSTLVLALGIAVGVGFLTKYAMVYAVLGMGVAALVAPEWRIRRSDAALAGVTALAVLAPHLWWLARHGFVTFHHLGATSGIEGISVSLSGPVRFLVEQLAVIGPVMFPACLLATARARPKSGRAGLAVIAAAPLVVVLVQAATGRALANWAVLFILPGSILAATELIRRPRLLAVSLVLGMLVSIGLPLAKVFGTGIHLPDGKLVLARYLGHGALSNWVIEEARKAGATTLVAQDRALLADLTWFGAMNGMSVRAVPRPGFPQNHWELLFPLDPRTESGPVLLVLIDPPEAPCAGAPLLATRSAGPAFSGGQKIVLFLLPDPTCLAPKGAGQ